MNNVTCKDEYLDERIRDVNSLDMHSANLRGADLMLDSRIPVIPRSFFSSPVASDANIVAITIGDIFVSKPLWSQDEKYRVSGKLAFNESVLQSPALINKKVILLFDAQDVLLEHLWWDRHDLQLFDTLARMGFHAVTTPNFSHFLGECPVGHAINTNKSLECGVEFEKRGLTVVPHIYGVHQAPLERWVEWLNAHTEVKTVTMNCQMQRKSKVGREIAVAALRHLLSKTDVKFILHGSDRRILSELKEFTERLHIADSATFKRAEIFRLSALTFGDVLSQNIASR